MKMKNLSLFMDNKLKVLTNNDMLIIRGGEAPPNSDSGDPFKTLKTTASSSALTAVSSSSTALSSLKNTNK